MKIEAAVLYEPNKPMVVEPIDLDEPHILSTERHVRHANLFASRYGPSDLVHQDRSLLWCQAITPRDVLSERTAANPRCSEPHTPIFGCTTVIPADGMR